MGGRVIVERGGAVATVTVSHPAKKNALNLSILVITSYSIHYTKLYEWRPAYGKGRSPVPSGTPWTTWRRR